MGVGRVGCLTLVALGLLLASSGTRAEEIANEYRYQHQGDPSVGTNQSHGACEYGGRWYGVGDAVATQEPCLVCTCTRASLVCHLRVCPAVSTTVPRGCYKLKKAGRCCPEVVCDGELESNKLYRNKGENEEDAAAAVAAEVRRRQEEAAKEAQEAAAAAAAEAAVLGTRRRGGTTVAGSVSIRGCVSDGAVFAEGSAMISPDPCSYCFCIRGRRRCVAPKCILPLQGCRPRYRSFSCCPNYYDCQNQTTTTTPSTTTIQSSGDCKVDGMRYEDGARVDGAEKNGCENCFCLRGQISCTNHTCDTPPDTEGCTPVMREGSCCPVSYVCDGKSFSGDLDSNRQPRERDFGDASPTNADYDELTSSVSQHGVEAETYYATATEDTLAEDTTEGSAQGEESDFGTTPSTMKPPPPLRPMSRPSLAEIARRRQESRFSSRRNNNPIRIQQPTRLQPRIQPTTEVLSLSERLKKRNKYTRTTSQAFTTTLSLDASQLPPTSATRVPEDTPPSTTTRKPTVTENYRYSATQSNRITPVTSTTNRYDRFTSTPTTKSDETTPTTSRTNRYDRFTSTPTTKKPRTTTKSEETAIQEDPTTRKQPKPNAFRWSKFRYHTNTDTTTSRPPFTTQASLHHTSSSSSSAEGAFTTPGPQEGSRHEVKGVGQVGEAVLVEDGSRLTPFMPHHTHTTPAWQKPVEVGTGVNVKGNLDDATVFGPILIFDNRVRTDRQQKTKNITELITDTEEDQTTLITESLNEETTALPEGVAAESDASDSESVPSTDPHESDKVEEEELTTTLSPFEPPVTTVKPEPTSSKTTQSTTTTPPKVLRFTPAPKEPVDIEYLDLDTSIPTYDITVGSSVLTTGNVHHSPVGVGQVIPVKLEPGDLMPHSSTSSNSTPEMPEPKDADTVDDSIAAEAEDQITSETETVTQTTPELVVTPDTEGTKEPAYKEVEDEENLKMEHKEADDGEILEAEHKTPETETVPEAPRPSILGALFNILTQTERSRPETTGTSRPRPERPRPDRPRPDWPRPNRPRPERPRTPRPQPDPTRTDRPRPENLPPPPRLPFRPRPRPNGRPDFIPPRFRFTPPPPPPETSTDQAISSFTTSETPISTTEAGRLRFTPPSTAAELRFRFTPPPPQTSTEEDITTQPPLQTSPSPTEKPEVPSPTPRLPPKFAPPQPDTPAPTPFIPPFLQPNPEDSRPGSLNTPPLPIFNLPDPIHTHQPRPFVPPGARPAPTGQRPPSSNQRLPSQPVMESGFQGMRKKEEGITPKIDLSEDYSYDTDEKPTLPPSLPNLKIIPFVAADALTGSDLPFSGEDPRSSTRPPLLPVLIPSDDQRGDTADRRQPEETTDSPPTTPIPTSLPTTPRRTLSRRPPILPPRRTPVRPSPEDSTRRPFLPFGRPGERPTRPTFKPEPSTTTPPPDIPDINLESETPFVFHDRPPTRPTFIPPLPVTPRITPRPTTPPRATIPSRPTLLSTPPQQPSLPIQSFRPKQTTILPAQTSRPIVSNDISNLLLQDVFDLPEGQNSPPVRFTTGHGTPKPIKPVKVPALPEIPAAVRDQLPLATDPVLASGLLKLSGCNIYGRMYIVKDRIPELSGKCKECRCTPVGVQCLPTC